jgi:ketosteroid isomerase-like protein
MKRMTIVPILPVLTSLFCSGLLAADSGAFCDSTRQAVEKAVLETHSRMTAAAQDRDAEKMFAFILDAGPGTIIQNGAYLNSRQDALEAVKKGMEGVTKVERSFKQTRVTVLASDIALLTGNGTTTITLMDGRVISSPIALTELFVLKDGEWKLLHGHHSVPNRQ